MARGTLVGEAFIRVHADNTAFAREVTTGMRGLAATGDNAGHDWGKRFFEGLKAELQTKMEKEFKEGFLTGDFTAFAKNFGSMQDALDAVNQRLITMRQHGGLARADFEDLRGVVNRFRDSINDATDPAQMQDWTASLGDAVKEIAKLRESMAKTVTVTEKFGESRVLKEKTKETAEFGRELNGLDRILDSIGRRMSRVDVSRVFGKGSRNDFLNIVGSVIGGITNMSEAIVGFVGKGLGLLGTGLGKLGEAVFGSLIERMRASSESFNEFATTLGSGLAGIGKVAGPVITVLATLVAVSGGVAIGIGLLGEALAVLTAIASNVVGALVIAAGAIGVGLAGAIGAAIPLVFALGAGITTLVVAFTNMSEKTKGIFKPLQDGFTKIATSISNTFFRDAPKWVGSLTDLLTTFAGPTMTKIAGSIRDSITKIMQDFQSAPIKKALKAWEDALGPIAGTLTTAIGKALQGITAFFVPLLPIAQEFAEMMASIAEEFADWAQSAEGQNSIANFFRTAWERAKQLFAITGQITEILGTLLRAGDSAAGKQFFGWLDDKLTQLRKFLDSPKGQNELAEWFKQAQKFADLVWKALEKVGDMLRRLNTPQAQEFASKLVIAFGRLADIVGSLSPLFDGVGKVVGFFLAAVSKALGALLTTFGWVADQLGGLFRLIGRAPGMGWAADMADDLEAMGLSAQTAGAMLVGLPDQIQIDFDAQDTDLILAAQNAQGIVNTQDGSTATTYFGGDIAGLTTEAGRANTVATGGPPGGPPGTVTTYFQGNIEKLVADAAGATMIIQNFMQETVKVPPTVVIEGDTLPLIDEINTANQFIKDNLDTTYETQFGGDTGLLMEATVDGNKIIEGVYPEWMTTLMGDPTPLHGTALAANDDLLQNVPIDWTTYFLGNPSDLTKQQAFANDEIIKVPGEWSTEFLGDTAPLFDSTIDGNEAIKKVLPKWKTDFYGDTGNLLDSRDAANAYIDGVHDVYTTEFGGDTGALLDATVVGQGYIGEVDPVHITDFTGDTGPLNKEAVTANSIINGVHDFNQTTFDGNTDPLNQDAFKANQFIDRVYDSNLTTFNGDPKPVNNAAQLATKYVDGVPDNNVTKLTVDMTGFIASVQYAKSLLNQLGQARVNEAGRAASGGIFGAMAGTILTGPRVVLAGEDGPEAIVPLRRSLARVDPSVRELSAFAQGMGGRGGINISEGAIQVTVPNSNPRLVAESVLDRLVARLS